MTTLAVAPFAAAGSFVAFQTVPRSFVIGPMIGEGTFHEVLLGGAYSDDIGRLKVIRLDRLERQVKVVTSQGLPEFQFQQRWQNNVEAIESAIRALATGQGNLSAIVQGLLETQEAVRQANERLAVAEAQAASTADYNRVRDSYSDGYVLSAQNVGGSVTVTIAAHQRHYLDPAEAVAVAGGTITGQPGGTQLFVYYDDPPMNGGAATFAATTDEASAVATMANPYRHKVGAILTPNTVGGGSTGDSSDPPWRTPRDPFL